MIRKFNEITHPYIAEENRNSKLRGTLGYLLLAAKLVMLVEHLIFLKIYQVICWVR